MVLTVGPILGTLFYITYNPFLSSGSTLMVRLKIPKPYQTWLFFVLATSWCSGLSFFILSKWFIVEGKYGLVKHAWQFPTLQIHGLAAFLMMLSLGFLLGTHVPYSWASKNKRKSGIGLLAMPVFLIISAYLLYYIAEGSIRQWVGYAHLAVGFLFPFILILHIVTKVKQRKITPAI